MLVLIAQGEELFDEETESFIVSGGVNIELEHSLISLSKWESKYQKPFLGHSAKTPEEILGYLEAMVVTEGLDPAIVYTLEQEAVNKIQEYIDSPQSATTFGEMPQRGGRGETITSELIYFWMVTYNIPFVCETWHLNRLFSLIKICNIKNSKPKKMSRSEMAQRNRELNAERRAKLGTKG